MPIARVKICGIIRPQDAALAAELGADAIGLNFVGGPRRLTWRQGAELFWEFRTPMFFAVIALIGQEKMPDKSSIDREFMQTVFDHSQFAQIYDFVQAGIDPRSCIQAFGKKFWMVTHIASRNTLSELNAKLQEDRAKVHLIRGEPAAIVMDTASAALGGTGQSFNWNWIAQAREAGELAGLPPLILAGGLTPDNVADAIRIAKPYAVDVSSGVEVPGKPGLKDPIKMRDFIQAAKSAL